MIQREFFFGDRRDWEREPVADERVNIRFTRPAEIISRSLHRFVLSAVSASDIVVGERIEILQHGSAPLTCRIDSIDQVSGGHWRIVVELESYHLSANDANKSSHSQVNDNVEVRFTRPAKVLDESPLGFGLLSFDASDLQIDEQVEIVIPDGIVPLCGRVKDYHTLSPGQRRVGVELDACHLPGIYAVEATSRAT
jgi:hypothetical protein